MLRTQPTLRNSLADGKFQPIIVQFPRFGDVTLETAPFVLDEGQVELGELGEGEAGAEFELVEEEGEVRLEVGEVVGLD